MSRLLAIASLALLAGCTSYAQRVTRTCETYGFSPGTDQFLSCVNQQTANDSYERAAWGRAGVAGAYLLRGPNQYVIVP